MSDATTSDFVRSGRDSESDSRERFVHTIDPLCSQAPKPPCRDHLCSPENHGSRDGPLAPRPLACSLDVPRGRRRQELPGSRLQPSGRHARGSPFLPGQRIVRLPADPGRTSNLQRHALHAAKNPLPREKAGQSRTRETHTVFEERHRGGLRKVPRPLLPISVFGFFLQMICAISEIPFRFLPRHTNNNKPIVRVTRIVAVRRLASDKPCGWLENEMNRMHCLTSSRVGTVMGP